MIITKLRERVCGRCQGTGKYSPISSALCTACLGSGKYVWKQEYHVPVTPEEAKQCNEEFWNG